MLRRLTPILCAAALASACHHDAPAKSTGPTEIATPVPDEPVRGPLPSVPAESIEKLTADTPRTTPLGTAFVAPGGWNLRTRGDTIVLEPPEGDSHLAFVDSKAKDADAAVAAAWQAYLGKPSPWAIKLATDQPAREGWDQIRVYGYETSENEKRNVFALAMRKAEAWTVVIVDLANATGEKRGGQLGVVFDRLRPSGYDRESFAGKPAAKLDAAHVKTLVDFVDQARKDLEIPGVAIGLIQDGKVLSRAASACASSASPPRSTPTRCSSSPRTPRR